MDNTSRGFGIDVYRHLADQPGNLFFSPYSLAAALSMTHAGAGEQTAAQMAAVLHLPPGDAVHGGFGALDAALTKDTDPNRCQLAIANALWLQDGYAVEPAFKTRVQTDYHGELGLLDFRTATEAARKRINTWTSDRTQGRIHELIGPGILNPLTRFVLTNAIYLKAAWRHPFNEAATQTGPFRLADGRTVQTPLMHLKESFGYAEVADAQLLEMRYAGCDLAMLVVLPRDADALPALERTLTADKLPQWAAQLKPREVVVTFPRFELKAALDMKPVLMTLGMVDAFGPRADFTGISPANDLIIAAVLHQANVTVTEAGTEAAAATAVIGQLKAAMPMERPVVFTADHPFLFLIVHRESGAVLFMGRLVEPAGGAAAPATQEDAQ